MRDTSHRRAWAMPLAIFAFLALSLSGGGALHLRAFRRDLRAQVERELSTIADIKVEQLVAWREQRLREWDDLDEDPFLGRAIAAVARGTSTATADELRATLWAIARRQGATAVELVGADGRTLLSAPGASAPGAEDLELLARARPRGLTVFSGSERASPRLTLVSPFRRAAGAGLVVHFDAERSLTPIVMVWPRPGSSAEPALVRREGDRIVTITRLRYSPGRVEMDPASEPPGPRAVRGETGVVETHDYRGAEVIAALRHVPGSDWYLSNKVDRAEMFAPARLRAEQLAGGVAVILLLSGALLLAWWQALRAEERRRAQTAAQESEKLRLRALLDQVNDIVVVVAEDGAILEANDRALQAYGYAREELVGRPAAALQARPDDWEPDFARACREGAIRFETRHRRKDGSTFPVEFSSRVFAAGGARILLGVGRDMSERQAAEVERLRLQAQLTFADRLASIGTLAAGVAHEINNPLSYLLTNLEYLERQLPPRGPGLEADLATTRDVLDEARDGARRIGEIVRSLRTFSRREREEHGRADLREAAQAAVRMAQAQARPRARLVSELGETPPVTGSEHELAQVVLNLVINAIQAVPEGRPSENEIRVATRTLPDGRVELTVSDTGIGIPSHHLEHVFDPFFTTKPVGEGSGLGLAICHGLVEAMGGTIGVQSAVGRGTTFTVTLAARAEERPAVPAAAAPGATGRRGRLLVVDDEPFVCRSVQRTLEEDHEVVALSDPREALARIQGGERFDLVLLDLVMPGISGMECYEALRQADPALAGRVLFLTGGAFTPNARRFLEENPGRWMEKPFDTGALRRKVAELLEAAPAA
ncbi:hybrid sensor histidine kinase/response regulator [Anaeromyxobacter paludicola]|uniref:histidine kinase n=1 Tax=Anaeromyxobacter paludicola TaxID=2918171 RepID=A0ABN6NA89_9BACT|nr:ATP-binding protein [Anaeromyxobacter paludicola]BDG10129.1 hypothetical protein AMPC_32420 [Anaeromyxobacter paludicola]